MSFCKNKTKILFLFHHLAVMDFLKPCLTLRQGQNLVWIGVSLKPRSSSFLTMYRRIIVRHDVWLNSTLLLTNFSINGSNIDCWITFWLVWTLVEGQNYVVQSYDHMIVRWKESRWSRLYVAWLPAINQNNKCSLWSCEVDIL